MRHTPNTKLQLRLINISFVILFLIAIGLLQWLSRDYHMQFDLTQNARNSLSQASIAVIKRLEDPVTITAYASQRGAWRRLINDLIMRYQMHKSDIVMTFIDPDINPEQVREAGVQQDGELTIEYAGAKETILPRDLNEENLTNAFTRLGHRGERWIVFLGGHGERSPDRPANFDFSIWAKQLNKLGFKTRTLLLGESPQIPRNTTALVIAGPRSQLLTGEIKEIENFIANGGNLLWLNDPGPLYGLEPIAEMLGIEFQPGVIVDPVSQALTGNANAVVIARYSNHPILKDFTNITLFPNAGGITHSEREGWTAARLLDTQPSAWSETGSLTAEIIFDKGDDIEGPLSLGMALTRKLDDREQRVFVIGDGDFLSNTFIANGGNLDLGMSLANWISKDDAYINIPIRTAQDRSLNLSQTSQTIIAVTFLVLLPLSLAGSGVFIWLRRRKL